MKASVLKSLPASVHRKDQCSVVSDLIKMALSHVWLGLPGGLMEAYESAAATAR